MDAEYKGYSIPTSAQPIDIHLDSFLKIVWHY